jgi:hypothetical protein
MARLLVHVEGETEETFVNELLAPHLYQFGYTRVAARLMGNARIRDRRGGIRGWDSVCKDVVGHLREDAGCRATTMVDYYGLPRTGCRAWPGRDAAASLPFGEKAPVVEASLAADIFARMGNGFDPRRFVPYVMIHEFEALLFSDCDRFGEGIGRTDLSPSFRAIRASFGSPEEINDSPATAPSKRVGELVPGYQKPHLGVLAALHIGLATIRAECPHFRGWLERLEAV